MQIFLSQQEIAEHNQLIVDLLTSANGSDVHLNDLAWFLQLEPLHVDCWMRQHGFGKWITGKNQHCWRGIGKQSIKRKTG